MELRILGPVELRVDERRHHLASPRLRGILAYLALNVGQVVPTDVLVDRLWNGDRPQPDTVYRYVSNLRNALRPAAEEVRIEGRDHGYVLRAEPDLIDYHRFTRLRQHASALTAGGELTEALADLRQAAALWTGRALENVRGDWAEQTRRLLEDEHLAATIARIKLELRLGHAADLVTDLRKLVADNPRHEELAELLMRALHGSGQTGEALEEYRKVRRRLVDEEGLEPGRALRELQGRILADDLDEPADQSDARPPRPPNNLDRKLPDFVGRQEEVEKLVAAFADPTPGAVGVVSIHGMPGVGKSTLANHLAHRLTASYPDAQIKRDLGAYGPQGPLDPASALARLLSRIGVPEDQIPPSLDDRSDLWRNRVAGRRTLILLDDASGYEQIRHLLPGASTSLVIITSRHRLTGLDGARTVSLAPLPAEDGAALLRAIVAPAQIDDEEALHQVVRLCDGLPLAIRLASNRLQDRTTQTVHDLADQLKRATDLLGEFDHGDRSVRVSFELSYRDLPEPRKRAFRLLSLHPGGDFTHHAAAAILGEPMEDVVRMIDLLLDDHLLEEHGRGRFRFHDLLRGYARERAAVDDDEPTRTASQTRLGDYFLATAERADAVLRPFARRRSTGERTGAEVPASMPDADEARRRMEMEIAGLIAYAQQEYLRRPEIAHAAAAYLDTTARWNEGTDIHAKAITGWREAQNPAGEAAAMVDLALADLRCSRLTEAAEAAREALITYQAIGDTYGEAEARDRLGLAKVYMAEYAEAIEHFDSSAKLRRTIGDDKGEADAFAHSGQALYFQGRYDSAVLMFERALTTYRRLGDTRGQQEVLNNLGDVQLRLGRPMDAYRSYDQSMSVRGDMDRPQDKAIHLANIASCDLALGATDTALTRFLEALDIYRQINDRYGEVDALDGIGSVYHATGDTSRALAHYQHALRIAREASEFAQTCRSLRHLGTLHSDSGDCRLAIAPLEEALTIARSIGEPYEQGMTLATLSKCLIHVGRTAEGRAHATESAQLMQLLGIQEA